MMRSVLEKHFECAEYTSDMRKEFGFMIVPLEGRPTREVDLDAFLFTVKTMLPSDAKLIMMVDGRGIAMSARGEYFMILASKNWAKVAEGANIPRLHPIRLREALAPPGIPGGIRFIAGAPSGFSILMVDQLSPIERYRVQWKPNKKRVAAIKAAMRRAVKSRDALRYIALTDVLIAEMTPPSHLPIRNLTVTRWPQNQK